MFDEFLSVLDDSPFDEIPVDVKTFTESPDYLGLPPLSDIQYAIVEAMSQIYYLETLQQLLGNFEGTEHFKKYTKTEIILKLGKGSGKDHISTIAFAYVVHKLLCLKDPSRYYGKPSGDAIDILNIAINAQQAKNVFFKGFKSKITRSPWFNGKYNPKTDSIDFDKYISVYSGHSERESHEGLNLILVVLDEISGFAIDNPAGMERAKTADAIYSAFRGTVDSRFDLGKVVLLSFPRYDGCFISKRYNAVVGEVNKVPKEHSFVIDPTRPRSDPDNIYTINWDEDHIVSYLIPNCYALCRPTWDVNPTKKIDDFAISFITNENDARGRFLAQPEAIKGSFFGRREKLQSSLVLTNPLDSDNNPLSFCTPIAGKKYYVHADLAQKVDRCAIGVSHVDRWATHVYSPTFSVTQPFIITDMIAYWEPKVGNPIDLKQVKEWIIRLRSSGFDVDLITFDRWNSMDMQRDLSELGFKCETLSVGKKHYEDLMVIFYEDRLKCPNLPVLYNELINLRVIGDRIEHPSHSGKDLSDALCGSVFNAAHKSPKSNDIVIEVLDFSSIGRKEDAAQNFYQLYNNIEISSSSEEIEFDLHII